MATTTRIEWADITINPVRGCSHCSPGCDNCYAERFAARLARIPNTARAYAGLVDVNGKWTGRFSVSLDTLDALSIKPRRIFVGSMCDLFHENLPYNLFLWIVEKLSRYPQHTFMLLTKRPERMKHFISLTKESDTVCGLWPLPNLWLGVTVCNRDELWKLDVLRKIPAALRFVSFEPLLSDLGNVDLSGIGWVIAGGETGPGARPMHPDWVRGLRDQCQAAEVPFFFKSWGEWLPCSDCPDDLDFEKHASGFIGDDGIFDAGNDGAFQCRNGVRDEQTFRVGKRTAGRLLDDREWNEVPS